MRKTLGSVCDLPRMAGQPGRGASGPAPSTSLTIMLTTPRAFRGPNPQQQKVLREEYGRGIHREEIVVGNKGHLPQVRGGPK